MEYGVIQMSNMRRLVDRVHEVMEDGWEPLGGVSVFCIDRFFWRKIVYVQAVIKKPKVY